MKKIKTRGLPLLSSSLLMATAVVVAAFQASCIIGVSSLDGVAAPERGAFHEPIQVVITVKGQVCQWGMANPPQSGDCPPGRLGGAAYYPAEVLAKIAGSIVSPPENERGISYYGPASVDANASHWAKVRGALGLPAVHPKHWRSDTGQASAMGLVHRTFGTVDEWQRFRGDALRNTLIIELDAKYDVHWSATLSFFTFGIFPGYQKHSILMQGTYYDAAGTQTSIRPSRKAKFNEWNHILFILWGPLVTVLTEDAPYAKLAKDILNQVPGQRRP